MNDRYSRYLFQKSHFSTNPPRIKPDAFIVAPEDKASVYQTDGVPDEKIWDIGRELGTIRGRGLKGRGDVSYEDIVSSELDIEVDSASPVAPELHRNIIGWGSNEKALQLVKAMKLANKAIALFPD